MTTPQKVKRLHYTPPAPVLIADGKRPGHKVVYIAGRWVKARLTADGWRMAGRVGKDLRELAREVSNA